MLEFRAWDDLSRKMYYRKAEQFDDMLGFRFEHFETENPIYMQCAGLKDKNGKEVYEGDIVKCKTVHESRYSGIGDNGVIRRVCFYKGSFALKAMNGFYVSQWNDGDDDWYSMENMDMAACEIIGNIHENGDLLNDIK